MVTNEPRKNRIISDQQAENITRVEELAYEIKVEEVMTRNAVTIPVTDPMRTALNIFRDMHISGAPVMNGQQMVGILSIEDLIRCMADNDLSAPISKYMTDKVISISHNEPVVEALKFFVNTRHGRLPVLDEQEHLVGILTKGDRKSVV